jgi:hypothetical protein
MILVYVTDNCYSTLVLHNVFIYLTKHLIDYNTFMYSLRSKLIDATLSKYGCTYILNASKIHPHCNI